MEQLEIQIENITNRKDKEIKNLEMTVSVLTQTLEDVKEVYKNLKVRASETERKLAVLKEAFAIITEKE